MYVLLRNIPDEICSHNTPYLMTIRWKSMYECVKFIYNNINFFEKSPISKVQESLQNIQKKIGWDNLFSMLQIMWDFICAVEKDLASIADILPPFLKATSQLESMNTGPSIALVKHLKRRFKETCPLNLPTLAFLLTQEGLILYRTNQNATEFFSDVEETMREYLTERGIDSKIIESNISTLKDYLLSFDANEFNGFKKDYDLWKCQSFLLSRYRIPYSFSKLASELLLIPASESTVERVFSALTKVTLNEMKKIKVETINSRLIIKYDCIFNKAGSVRWEELMKDPFFELRLFNY